MNDFLNCDDNITIRISAITCINWYIYYQEQQCVEVKGMFKTVYLFLNSPSDFKAIQKLALITEKDLSDILEIYNQPQTIDRVTNQKLSTDEINELIRRDETLLD